MSYDQKTWSFATPTELERRGQPGREAVRDSLILSSYENVRETVTIDRQGNMTVTREWLEGNADQSLPDAVYNQYKHLMPSHGAGHDPVVRSVYANGVLRYYTKRGRVARETRVDAGAFRVPVAALDSMKARSRRNENAQTRSAEILRGLAERGVPHQTRGGRYVEMTASATGEPDRAISRRVLDLETGGVVRQTDRRTDGRVTSEHTFRNQRLSGQPVADRMHTRRYGERDGRWEEVARTVVERNNIELIVN